MSVVVVVVVIIVIIYYSETICYADFLQKYNLWCLFRARAPAPREELKGSHIACVDWLGWF